MNKVITIWKDGTSKLWNETDAHYACNDTEPDWFLNITLSEADIVEQFKSMCCESINPDLYSVLEDDILPALRTSRPDCKPKCKTCKGKGFIKSGKYGVPMCRCPKCGKDGG